MKNFLRNIFFAIVFSGELISLCAAQPIANFSIDYPNPVCNPATISFTNTSFGNSPLTYQWFFETDTIADTSVNPIHLFASCGSFSVALIVTDTSLLSDTTSQTVIINCTPQAAFTYAMNSVCDSSSVQFTDASNSQDTIVTWQWVFDDPGSGPSDSSQLQNPFHFYSAPGNYSSTLMITTVNGCTSSVSHTIIIHNLPSVEFSFADSVVCFNSAMNFFGTSAQQDSITDWQYTFGDSASGANNFSNSQNASHVFSSPGNYSVTLKVISIFGCENEVSHLISVKPLPIADAGNDTAICNGNSATLHATGGINFHWEPTATLSSDSIYNPVATPFSTTKYFVTVTDSFGCSAIDSVSVVVDFISVDAGNDTVVCKASTATLHAVGGISFHWQPSSSLSNDSIENPVASPQQTTTYTVTITNSFGCVGIDSVTVMVHSPMPASIIGLNASYCSNHEAVELQADPSGGIFSGSGVSGNQFDPSSVPSNNTYDVLYTYTDSFGCASTDTETVFIHSIPVVDITSASDHVCLNGSPVTLMLTPAGGILTGTGISGTTFDPQLAGASGNYKIFYFFTDSFGCSNKDSTLISILSLPNIIATGDTSICVGDSAQLNVTGGSTYFWFPPTYLTSISIPNPIAFPPVTTVFTVIGIDNSGCSNFDTVLITVTNGNVSAGNDTAICIGSSVTLHGSGGNTYSWSPGILLSDSTISNPNALLQTTTTFYLIAATGGCIGKDTVVITVNLLPQIDAGFDTSFCFGDTTHLHATGGTNYQWQPSAYLSDPFSSNPIAFPPSTTTYFVTGTDANGCSNIDSVHVNVFPVPQVFVHVDSAMCFGDTISMYATGAIVYDWTPTTGLSAPDNSSTLAFPQITTTYTVIGYGANDCFNTADTTITVHPLPVINATADQFVCPNAPVQLSSSGGNIYSWQPSQGLNNASINNPIATVSSTTTFIVTVTDTNFCSNKDSVTLTILPPLAATVSNDTIVCTGTSAQLLASGGVSYVWIPSTGLNDGNIPDPISTPASTIDYSVFISDGVCYTDTLNVKVTVQSLPSINAGPDADIISGSSYQLNVIATEGTYQWLPEEGLNCATCLNPKATPQQTTTFSVTVTDSAGCKASDDITLTITCGDDVVFVPNAFTPNDNGHNDILYIREIGNLQLHYFRVFDRWGKIIFDTHDFGTGWDGTDQGKPMSPGAYLYEWSVSCENGTEVKKEGNVTLLR